MSSKMAPRENGHTKTSILDQLLMFFLHENNIIFQFFHMNIFDFISK